MIEKESNKPSGLDRLISLSYEPFENAHFDGTFKDD